jgi:hypothetical protein
MERDVSGFIEREDHGRAPLAVDRRRDDGLPGRCLLTNCFLTEFHRHARIDSLCPEGTDDQQRGARKEGRQANNHSRR